MRPNTVVIVEDDPLVRFDAVTLIREAGMHVVDMDSADQALAYVWRCPRDVAAIFSDIEVPGHTDGADLARTVSYHWPHIRLLITSGRSPDSKQLPANSKFLPKPWLPLDVLTAIQGRLAA